MILSYITGVKEGLMFAYAGIEKGRKISFPALDL